MKSSPKRKKTTVKARALACGLKPSTVYERIRRGVDPDQLYAPVMRIRATNTSPAPTSHPEYNVWRNMRRRCHHMLGMHMDPAWDRFDRFLADVGPRPSPAHHLRLKPEHKQDKRKLYYTKESVHWVLVDPPRTPKTSTPPRPVTGRLDWLLKAVPEEE